jgi:hypothetical protein
VCHAITQLFVLLRHQVGTSFPPKEAPPTLRQNPTNPDAAELTPHVGYDCSFGADDTQNGATTKSPRTPWTTVMTMPNTQTGSSVPSSSQSTAASRCRVMRRSGEAVRC